MGVYERMLFDHFRFSGFHGCQCICSLEILTLADGRTAVIATELEDNPGTSITNVAENLASEVCDRFGIDPQQLIWIEHYGYAGACEGTKERTFDRVTFSRRDVDGVQWTRALGQHKPDGWPGYFQDPNWRPMKDEDWWELGLSPRPPVTYES